MRGVDKLWGIVVDGATPSTSLIDKLYAHTVIVELEAKLESLRSSGITSKTTAPAAELTAEIVRQSIIHGIMASHTSFLVISDVQSSSPQSESVVYVSFGEPTAVKPDWTEPPCITRWKKARGFIIPLEKRLAADGRGLVGNKYARFSESVFVSERPAPNDPDYRGIVHKRLGENLRLATAGPKKTRVEPSTSGSSSSNISSSSSNSEGGVTPVSLLLSEELSRTP